MNTSLTPLPRTPLHLDVSFKRNYARHENTGTLTNISLSGAFLEVAQNDLRKNEKINLVFVVGDRERKISAEVIWVNSSGAGIKFSPQNNRDVQIVDDLIYYVEEKRLGYRGIFDGFTRKVG